MTARGRGATVGSDPGRVPRGVAPETWRLVQALVLARSRLPFSTAEARLLDGLVWFVKCGARGVGGVVGRALRPEGPGWADALALVSATAKVCSADTQSLLAPWVRLAPSAPGVAPSVSDGSALDFRPFGG